MILGFKPNIGFAGLTAAGKTTHSKLLAQVLGYEYISATEILLDLAQVRTDSQHAWFTSYDAIEKAREGDRVDKQLEEAISLCLQRKNGLVIDSWAMAYIYPGPMIRIWIDSDIPSRMRKCYVSQGDNPMHTLEECLDLIQKKDSDSRSRFLLRHHFDLFKDMNRYDAILTNSSLIPEATEEYADRGIESFKKVVHDVVEYFIAKIMGKPTSHTVQSLHRLHRPYIITLREIPWSFSSESQQ